MFKLFSIASLLFICQFSMAFEYTLSFSESDIQSRIDEILPVKKETFVVVITIDQAKVRLLERVNQVALDTKLFVNGLAGINAQGRISVQGEVTYRSAEGAFYLSHPVITKFTVDQVPQDILPKLKELAQAGLDQALFNKAIYVLKDDDMRHQLLKSSLKSIVIKDKILKATLGI